MIYYFFHTTFVQVCNLLCNVKIGYVLEYRKIRAGQWHRKIFLSHIHAYAEFMVLNPTYHFPVRKTLVFSK